MTSLNLMCALSHRLFSPDIKRLAILGFSP